MDKETTKRLENAERLARSIPHSKEPLERRSYFSGGKNYARFVKYMENNECIAH